MGKTKNVKLLDDGELYSFLNEQQRKMIKCDSDSDIDNDVNNIDWDIGMSNANSHLSKNAISMMYDSDIDDNIIDDNISSDSNQNIINKDYDSDVCPDL